jgi:hypothetical protein
MESRFAACLNGLLQQNRHLADIEAFGRACPLSSHTGHPNSLSGETVCAADRCPELIAVMGRPRDLRRLPFLR